MARSYGDLYLEHFMPYTVFPDVKRFRERRRRTKVSVRCALLGGWSHFFLLLSPQLGSSRFTRHCMPRQSGGRADIVSQANSSLYVNFKDAFCSFCCCCKTWRTNLFSSKVNRKFIHSVREVCVTELM